jgi:prolyl oligopeptidase
VLTPIAYPRAPRLDLVEHLHGVPVSDPFRSLETADGPETQAWVGEENALTRQLLDGPLRDQLVERLGVLHRYPRSSMPAVRGRLLFFLHNDGTLNQARLCVREDAEGSRLKAAPVRVLLDPNTLDEAGTTAITEVEPDDHGRRIVYALSLHGSDVQELRVLDVATGHTLPDRIRWVKFASVAWTNDGFFYTRFPAPGSVPPGREQYFCQVWFHRLGEAQEIDRLVYDRPDAPEVVFDIDITSDGRHLVITSRHGSSDKAEIHLVDAAAASGLGRTAVVSFRALATGFADAWHFVDGADGRLFFRTDAGAPRGRIVRLDVDETGGAGVPPRHEVVPESGDTIVDAVVTGGRLLVHSLHNASSRLDLVGLDGQDRRSIALPSLGSVVSIAARWGDPRAAVVFMSFTTPLQALEVVADTFEQTAPELNQIFASASAIESARYETDQVWYPSKDGTPISMFLVRRLGGDPGPRPVLLTAYGGFNISLTPTFDPSDFLWLDAGGIVAVPHLRGGGEYGEAWHQAGMLERKQNVFDDFITAAEWLLATGRAAPGQIAIEGGSNGGLLVGAVMVQRPDLFGAVICRVPVADMLRYHRFTVGRFWIPEYGSADDPQQFVFLRRYSPYHNIVDSVAYPPTLVMTADTDDRVDPGMAKKFAARLQEAVAGTSGGPILLRVETRAGHGAGKPIGKQIDEQADMYAFLFHYLTRASVSAQQRR